MSEPIHLPDEPEHGGCGTETPRKRDVPFPDERPITLPLRQPQRAPEYVPAEAPERERVA